ncbi:MAG: hypothetical protein PHS48_04685 [Bacteroidales bacterium]|nr:hypothetical protein [Bacteroidales bacterium]
MNKDTGREHSAYSYAVQANNSKPEGYTAIISYQDGFLAAGSDGRIDRISKSGTITNFEKFPEERLNCLLSYDQTVIAGGDNGSLLISSSQGVSKINSGTDRDIHTLALFKEKILAGTDQGEILIGDKNFLFRKINLPLKGNIVSLSARSSDCYGATDEGEIIHTADGIQWDIFDFNRFYSGYYKPCLFTKILATENRIAVAGKHDDGSPVLMFSARGNVWTERTLEYTNDEVMTASLEDIPYDLFYDSGEDLFILCCSQGKVMTIPSCSHCNKLEMYSTEGLRGIAGIGDVLMLVGENYYLKAINRD